MTLADIFHETASKFMAAAGATGAEVEAALKQIATDMEPEFEQALQSEDLHSLDFIADRVAARTAQVAVTAVADVKSQLGILAFGILKGAILLAA